MHTNVMLTDKRCTNTQSNYTNTKLEAWSRRLLRWTNTGVMTQK